MDNYIVGDTDQLLKNIADWLINEDVNENDELVEDNNTIFLILFEIILIFVIICFVILYFIKNK